MPAAGVCPRCRRAYPRPARVCPVDGTMLVDEERLAASQQAPGSAASSHSGAGAGAGAGAAEVLGQYRLVRQLGEGGMARIYLAEHVKLGRICAIKRLHADHFEDRITVARFLAEARAVSDISHPNLVAVYDVVEEPNEIYIVMEYLDGVDVAAVLRDEGRFEPRRAAEIAAQACDGLAAVHARDIIHRDLKPENIFLARDPAGERVKLLDFGVARLTIDRPKELRTRSGLTVGTPTYMSPEQATASPLDARSDLYAIGVLLYEMIAGVPPFVGAGYGDVMLMHVNDPPPALSSRRADVPSWLEAVVMRCLEKEPEARYQTATELAAALRSSGTAQVTVPRRTPPPQPATKKRWPAAAALAGIGAVAVAVVVAAIAWPQPAPIVKPPIAEPIAAPATVPISATAPASEPRKLQVSTTPLGARVAVDGIERCRTPCAVELPDNAPSAQLDVSADGYAPERRLIDLAAPPPSLTLILRRAPVRKGGPPHAPPRTSPPNRNATVDPFH